MGDAQYVPCPCSTFPHPAGVPGCETFRGCAIVTREQSDYMERMVPKAMNLVQGVVYVRSLVEEGR